MLCVQMDLEVEFLFEDRYMHIVSSQSIDGKMPMTQIQNYLKTFLLLLRA